VEPTEIESAQDLKRILAEQINLIRTAQTGDLFTRGRLIGYLAGQALRVLEVGELEARIRAIEEQIGRPK